jgi:hypothetical protein
VVTDLSRDNMLCGATDPAALLALYEALPATTINFLPSLHAKVFVADERCAVITSSNLTDGGLWRNLEYGVSFADTTTVRRIREDILRYGSLGSPIGISQLRLFASITAQLREANRAAQRSVRRALQNEFDRRLIAADEEILRARTAGRTAHAIFADAILFLLRNGPMRTIDIHRQIQQIHPDLCDDSVDRVIDGRHFGKLWKHEVRTAQVFLRRGNKIERDGSTWRMTHL